MKPSVIFSCEHGGNEVPEKWRSLFSGAEEVLLTHRGWDIGALDVARTMATEMEAPLFFSRITRLLVEANRSLLHPQLFSEYTRHLDARQKEEILQEVYHPYRHAVEEAISQVIVRGEFAVHVSVHSFTPVWEGKVRKADFGLLYDPDRKEEQALCEEWGTKLAARVFPKGVRHNYPYLGTDDGLTTYLRTRFERGSYAGIELEINQALLQNPQGSREVALWAASSLDEAMKSGFSN
jgi:predicted N-formylglutamate amidohydrolase